MTITPPQATRATPAAAGPLLLALVACPAPRHQGPLASADRVAAAREAVALRLAEGGGLADAPPRRSWAEPKSRTVLARVVRAAGPLCPAERVGCRFDIRLAAGAGEANASASGGRDVTLTGPLLDRLPGKGGAAFVMAHEAGRHLCGQAPVGGAAAAGVPLTVLAGAAGGDGEDALGAFGLGALAAGVGAAVRHGLVALTEAGYLRARAGYDPAAGREVMLGLASLRSGAGALVPGHASLAPGAGGGERAGGGGDRGRGGRGATAAALAAARVRGGAEPVTAPSRRPTERRAGARWRPVAFNRPERRLSGAPARACDAALRARGGRRGGAGCRRRDGSARPAHAGRRGQVRGRAEA